MQPIHHCLLYSRARALLIRCGLALFLATFARGTYCATLTTVALGGALSGTPYGPGDVGRGVSFQDQFARPTLAANGSLAFLAALNGPGVTPQNNLGVWTGPPGTLAVVARNGDMPSDVDEGFTFDVFGTPNVQGMGEGVLYAALAGPGTAVRGSLWRLNPGGVQFVAQTDASDPDLDFGVQFSSLNYGPPAINDGGEIVFQAAISGLGVTSATSQGIWGDSGGFKHLVARTGTSSGGPFLGSGIRFKILGSPSINATDEVAFWATLTGPTVDATNDMGIWAGQAIRRVIARTGNTGPGPSLGPGIVFGSIQNATSIADSGDVCFRANLSGLGVNALNDEGIWLGGPGRMRIVMREGDTAPLPSGGADVRFGSTILMDCNNLNEVVFAANLRGIGVNTTNDESLWRADDAGLTLLAREGESLPGLPRNVVVERFSSVGINDIGQVAVMTRFRGPGFSDLLNSVGVWVFNANGRAHLLARSGQTIDADSGIERLDRTISRVDAYTRSSSGGLVSGFNSLGAVALHIQFTDGSSGLFRSEPIPEPSAVAIAAIAIAGGVVPLRVRGMRFRAAVRHPRASV